MQEYDNAGGLNEMQDSFETLPEAQRAAAQNRYDISEVVDRDTWEIVWKAWRAHESLNSIASPEKQA
jgi:hypothetical protein